MTSESAARKLRLREYLARYGDPDAPGGSLVHRQPKRVASTFSNRESVSNRCLIGGLDDEPLDFGFDPGELGIERGHHSWQVGQVARLALLIEHFAHGQ